MRLQDIRDEPLCVRLHGMNYSSLAKRDGTRRLQSITWSDESIGTGVWLASSLSSAADGINHFYDMVLDRGSQLGAKELVAIFALSLLFVPVVPARLLISLPGLPNFTLSLPFAPAVPGMLYIRLGRQLLVLYSDDRPRNLLGYILYGRLRLTVLYRLVWCLQFLFQVVCVVVASAIISLEIFRVQMGGTLEEKLVPSG